MSPMHRTNGFYCQSWRVNLKAHSQIPVKKDPGIQNGHADPLPGKPHPICALTMDLIFDMIHMQDSSMHSLLLIKYSVCLFCALFHFPISPNPSPKLSCLCISSDSIPCLFFVFHILQNYGQILKKS